MSLVFSFLLNEALCNVAYVSELFILFGIFLCLCMCGKKLNAAHGIPCLFHYCTSCQNCTVLSGFFWSNVHSIHFVFIY